MVFFRFYTTFLYIYLGMARKSYKSYLLPNNFKDMEEFILGNKPLMVEQVLNSIDHALNKNLKFVEVFQFANSDFVAVISKEKFKENLDNIYNYYITQEMYELCPKVKKLEKKLEKASVK